MKNKITISLLKLINFIETLEHIFYPPTSTKIQESYTPTNSISILSENSKYIPISSLHITKPFPLHQIKTKSTSLIGADHHLISPTTSTLKTISSLTTSHSIKLSNHKTEQITHSKTLNLILKNYDLSLSHSPNTYITNNIISHNTTTASIFNSWYTLFNYDKTTLIAANKFVTAKEILNKTKNILEALPFFLKPGIRNYAQTQITTDANSKIIAESTTERTGIGFTIDNLYIDEAAHLLASIFKPFYENLVPTISSLKHSKITLTSTQNGFNHFYDLWNDAIKQKNNYKPTKIDYWQVPGRDEEWKKEQIAILGSEESFNRQYGTEFVSYNGTLLSPYAMNKLRTTVEHYLPQTDNPSTPEPTEHRLDFTYQNTSTLHKSYLISEFTKFQFSTEEYSPLQEFKIRQSFDIEDLYDKKNRFIITVDISEGLGLDNSVINLFQIKYNKDEDYIKRRRPTQIQDLFYIEQCGLLKNNRLKIEDLAKVIIALYRTIGPENLLINIEYNTYGQLLIDKLFNLYNNLDENCIAKHYHNKMASTKKFGLKITNSNKPILCNEFRNHIDIGKIIISNGDAVNELSLFGKNNKGNYEGLGSTDDIAMSCIEVGSLFSNEVYLEMVEDMIDEDKEIELRFNGVESEFENEEEDDIYDIF